MSQSRIGQFAPVQPADQVGSSRTLIASLRTLLVINSLAFVGFIMLAAVRPAMTDVDVRMRYTQLDREHVINEDALKKFDPSYGFHDSRNGVPRYIAAPALKAEKEAVFFGLLTAIINLLLTFVILRSSYRFVQRSLISKTSPESKQ